MPAEYGRTRQGNEAERKRENGAAADACRRSQTEGDAHLGFFRPEYSRQFDDEENDLQQE